jgi:hypothetical protein
MSGKRKNMCKRGREKGNILRQEINKNAGKKERKKV